MRREDICRNRYFVSLQKSSEQANILKGTGFSPYIKPAKSTRALDPGGMLAFPGKLVQSFIRRMPKTSKQPSAFAAVKQFANCFPSSRVRFCFGLVIEGAHGAINDGLFFFGLAARGAAVGETRLIGLQFKLSGTDDTGSNRKRHLLLW
jgi:hypothetical protein